jgi:hypothetical protein
MSNYKKNGANKKYYELFYKIFLNVQMAKIL